MCVLASRLVGFCGAAVSVFIFVVLFSYGGRLVWLCPEHNARMLRIVAWVQMLPSVGRCVNS